MSTSRDQENADNLSWATATKPRGQDCTRFRAGFSHKMRSKMPSLRSRFPARKVFELLGSERIDRKSQSAQLKTRDFLIDLRRQQMNAGSEFAFILDQILDRERLVGKAHVHDAGRMAFGGREIDQPAFAQNVYSPAIFKFVFLHKRTHLVRLT